MVNVLPTAFLFFLKVSHQSKEVMNITNFSNTEKLCNSAVCVLSVVSLMDLFVIAVKDNVRRCCVVIQSLSPEMESTVYKEL